MQQWARIYIELPQSPSIPRERARVRSVLFLGMDRYFLHVAVEMAPTHLHLSVFLFYIGLVVFFLTVYKTVAIATLISVGIFGLAYLILIILPCVDHSCPYRTPMSRLWWYLWHTSFSHVARCLRFLLRQLHDSLVPYTLGDITFRRQRILNKWWKTIKNLAEKHGKRLEDGFRWTLVESTIKASQEIDVKALTWLFQLPALTEKNKIQKFVASIPGDTIVQLLSNSVDHGKIKITFRHHLLPLPQLCAKHGRRTHRGNAQTSSFCMLKCRPPGCQSIGSRLAILRVHVPIERHATALCKNRSHATPSSASPCAPFARCSRDSFCASLTSKQGSCRGYKR